MSRLLKALLGAIVDYAGLYPPAQLDLRSAMQTYAHHIASPAAWMLSRFVLPAARLEEFTALTSELPLSQWSLSVVVKSLEEAKRAFTLQSHRVQIAALEFTPRSPAAIQAILPELPPGIEAFFEIPLDPSLPDAIAALQGTSAAAKIRTGGVTESAFPDRRLLAEWICACAQASVPFKATAGLHHPFPGRYRLTSEPNSPTAPVHGFLNVAIAAAFAYSRSLNLEQIIQLLEIDSLANSLQLQEEQIIWQGPQEKCELTLNEAETARQHFFRSFGSCSFQEPIDDLRKLALMDD